MPATKPASSALQMWWPMDETSGNRDDSDTGDYDLTDGNTVGYTSGKVGNAAHAVATSLESLYRADGAELDFLSGTNSWTLAGWMRATALPSAHMRCLCKYASTSTQMLFYRQYIAGGSKMSFLVYDSTSGSAIAQSSGDINAAQWYFVVLRFDGSTKKPILRIDTTNYTASTGLTNGVRDGTASLKFGNYDGAATGYWNGDWDEWAAWNVLLTDDECDWLYNSGAGRGYTELVNLSDSISLIRTATVPAVGLATGLGGATLSLVRTLTAAWAAGAQAIEEALSLARTAAMSNEGLAALVRALALARAHAHASAGGAAGVGSALLQNIRSTTAAGMAALSRGVSLATVRAAVNTPLAYGLGGVSLARVAGIAVVRVASTVLGAVLGRAHSAGGIGNAVGAASATTTQRGGVAPGGQATGSSSTSVLRRHAVNALGGAVTQAYTTLARVMAATLDRMAGAITAVALATYRAVTSSGVLAMAVAISLESARLAAGAGAALASHAISLVRTGSLTTERILSRLAGITLASGRSMAAGGGAAVQVAVSLARRLRDRIRWIFGPKTIDQEFEFTTPVAIELAFTTPSAITLEFEVAMDELDFTIAALPELTFTIESPELEYTIGVAEFVFEVAAAPELVFTVPTNPVLEFTV